MTDDISVDPRIEAQGDRPVAVRPQSQSSLEGSLVMSSRVAVRHLGVLAALLPALVLFGCAGASTGSSLLPPFSPLPPLPPSGRAYVGVHPDWERDSPAAYVARTGVRPAVYGNFAEFPMTSTEEANVQAAAALVRAQGAALFLTLEPAAGLGAITPATAAAAAKLLAGINATGVAVYLRFAHEMNGSWYPWGQQPAAYVDAFRTFAKAVHQVARQTYLVWSPNYGSGYPYAAGAYSARPGSPDFDRLDTDHDGLLTLRDDMYAPFYPGDEYVDWVGLTMYFFGLQYPWAENEVPDEGRFEAQLSGSYRSSYGDERELPDFYADYALAHGKAMALSETGAWFTPGRTDGAREVEVKVGWMGQVFSPRIRARFPKLAMIIWFEQSKTEQEARGTVDWRLTFAPQTRDALKARLAADPDHYTFAGTRSVPSS